jgi:hypothetical protein
MPVTVEAVAARVPAGGYRKVQPIEPSHPVLASIAGVPFEDPSVDLFGS